MKIHEVEQNTPEWITLRSGIPTASEFGNLVTSEGKTSKSMQKYARTLAAEKYTGGEGMDSWQGNSHTERGHDLEDNAALEYSFMTGTALTKVGFVTDDNVTMGCSPDRLVCDNGLLEIKCLSAAVHVETVLYYQKHKKAPPKYYQQTQGQMMICERQWCDLFFFHPTLPSFAIHENKNSDFHVVLMLSIEQVEKQRDEAIKALENI